MARYSAMTTDSIQLFNRKGKANAAMARIMARRLACRLLTRPAAMGRLHFLGCFLSASTSTMSLMEYMAEAAKENATKATREEVQSAMSNKLPPKNSGMKMNVFFTHWCGRNILSIFISLNFFIYRSFHEFAPISSLPSPAPCEEAMLVGV